jgi:hypothetical protein
MMHASPPLQTVVIFGASGDLARRSTRNRDYRLGRERHRSIRRARMVAGGSSGRGASDAGDDRWWVDSRDGRVPGVLRGRHAALLLAEVKADHADVQGGMARLGDDYKHGNETGPPVTARRRPTSLLHALNVPPLFKRSPLLHPVLGTQSHARTPRR